MRALVAVASKHGSTREIAGAVAEELRAGGVDAVLREAGEVEAIDGYGAVVLGSAVYVGNWLPEARQFVERHRAGLAQIPFWLFSSGPLGADDPQPPGDPAGIAELMQTMLVRDHRVFVGKLDGQSLGFVERLIARAVHAPEGDFRDWGAIRGWAREIGTVLGAQPAAMARS